MSNEMTIAVITAVGGLLVAAITAVAAILGPMWSQSRARTADAATAAQALRLERALDFLSAVAAAAQSGELTDVWRATEARVAFIGTLKAGEQDAEFFTRRILAVVKNTGAPLDKPDIFNDNADVLLKWIRGDGPLDPLNYPSANWGDVVIAEIPESVMVTGFRSASAGSDAVDDKGDS